MSNPNQTQHLNRLRRPGRVLTLPGLTATLAFVLLLSGAQRLFAQGGPVPPPRLPSAEKVVEGYLKAIGGKKRVAQIRDAVSEWTIQLNDQPLGHARIESKAPGSLRSEMTFGNGQIISAANTSSAWEQGLNVRLRTLTGAEAAAAKLQALLETSQLVDYKKRGVLARVISLDDLPADRAYIVEFSTRGGARLRYWFSLNTHLLVKVEDEVRKTTARYSDYRPVGPLDVVRPHRMLLQAGAGELTFVLQQATYNSGIPNSSFDPPAAAEALDVTALLRDVARNQDEVEKRVTEYAFVQKEIDREINDKGELKKETSKVFEVFPIAHREPIMKLISENGVPLPAERAAKEQKRVEEEFLKAERDRDKDEEKAAHRKAELQRKQATRAEKGENDDPELSQFLKVCEFVSPRRERFRDRDAVVFDFRPRPNLRPSNLQEKLISKLVGVVWIDALDKQVMRLDGRLAEGFKMGGGLVLSLRPGAAFSMEQTRMAEGVWLPRLAQVNLSVKVLLFGGGDVNKTIEWSDYRHFKGDVGDYKLDSPNGATESPKKP